MNCVDIEILLQLAADGEVTDDEKLLIETHLDECVACRRKEAWLEQLDAHLSAEKGLALEEQSALADAVVAALQEPAALVADTMIETDTVSKKSKAKRKKKAKKKGLVLRLVAMVWPRKRAKKSSEKQPKRNQNWIDASVGAMVPAPTSLDGFRAAKQGVSTAVSGPVRAVRWVSGVTRIGKGKGA